MAAVKVVALQDAVCKEIVTLIVLKALNYSQQEEADLAVQLMMECQPDSPKLQKAFLNGVCLGMNMESALHWLQYYSEQADQQLYSAVLERLASRSGMHKAVTRSHAVV